MDFNNINKFPIVIACRPRTGSTGFAHHLHFLYPFLRLFLEPDRDPSEFLDFLDFAANNNQYILKTPIHNLIDYPDNHSKPVKYPRSLLEKIMSDAYIIKLQRKNEIERIASLYIAKKRNIWWYTTEEKLVRDAYADVENSPIDIDMSIIDESILESILQDPRSNSIRYDQEIFYEDIPLNWLSIHMQTPKPLNYDELLLTIQIRLNTLLPHALK
jgi:hypothetical protein